MLKDLVIPLGIIALIGSMIVPMPSFLLDILLVSNLIFALSLLILTMYVAEPLSLSVLPSLLLIATLIRLSLNISTTRMILGAGEAGKTVEAFGALVIQGNIAVGAVVFIIITLVQFLVVAKGAERVAEVSARFSLDAMPGRQMSIDADVRAGLCDFETARQKRQELQTESRFYGALDGAMKFVKGDAIAGIVIVIINVVGGLVTGLAVEGLDLQAALAKYTILTVGDGLLAQIPALLNALGAGMVVTRVARGDNSTLSAEIVYQLSQLRRVPVICGLVALALSLVPAMPVIPFLLVGVFLLVCAASGRGASSGAKTVELKKFRPRVPQPLRVEVDKGLSEILVMNGLAERLEEFRQTAFDKYGVALPAPEFGNGNKDGRAFRIFVRGLKTESASIPIDAKDPLGTIFICLEHLLDERVVDLIDDISTRRLLDYLDSDFPELVSAVVPSVISVTQLSEILKELAREHVSLRHFDMILQAVAEAGGKVSGERAMLEAVRAALKRQICSMYASVEGIITGFTLDPILDMAIAKSEEERLPLNTDLIMSICNFLERRKPLDDVVLIVSRRSRRLIRECLELNSVKIPVIAHEELAGDFVFRSCGHISLDDAEREDAILEELAA